MFRNKIRANNKETNEEKRDKIKNEMENRPDKEFLPNPISALWTEPDTYVRLKRLEMLNKKLKTNRLEPDTPEDVFKEEHKDMIDQIESESFPGFKINHMWKVLGKLREYGLKGLKKIVDDLAVGDLKFHDRSVIHRYVV